MIEPSAVLRALADAFWEDFLQANPVFATILGDRRFDDRLDRIDPQAIAANRAMYARYAAAARALAPETLAPRDRVTRSMLIDEVEGAVAGIDAGLHRWTVDPMGGPQTTLLDLPDYQPVRTAAEGEALVARWRAMGPYFDQHIANLRDGLGDGLAAVAAPVDRVIDILDGLDRTPDADWAPMHTLQALPDDWPEADRAALRGVLTGAVTSVLRPAFARYRAFLADEVRPLARSSERPGIMHLPGGAEAYRAMIRVHTTLETPAEEIHRIGLAEVKRIDAEFAALGARVLGTDGTAETLARLRTDPALRFSTADEVHAAARRALAAAEAAVPAWFGRLPKARCEVVRIPAHAEAHQTLAYYSWPALDGSRPGQFFINLHAPETRARYEAEALAFHESVPGHHLQLAIAQELEGLPAFQRNLGSNAFAEGWGLYTERLADEMGLYSSDLDHFGVLSFDAWRACRLVVDTGMHALGWTRDQAIAFMREHTALDDGNIANEIDRYIVWPGQALAYKLGQLEILRLRAEARAALGERFDIRAFHDAILGSGAVSLGTLGEIVRGWVAARA